MQLSDFIPDYIQALLAVSSVSAMCVFAGAFFNKDGQIIQEYH